MSSRTAEICYSNILLLISHLGACFRLSLIIPIITLVEGFTLSPWFVYPRQKTLIVKIKQHGTSTDDSLTMSSSFAHSAYTEMRAGSVLQVHSLGLVQESTVAVDWRNGM